MARLRTCLLCGPSLAGKSTLAEKIAAVIPVSVLSADEINAERGLPFGGEGLPESVWAETLRLQVERYHQHLAHGRSVLIDDTLCYRWLRDRWRQEASKASSDPVLLLLAPSKAELLSRRAALSRSARRPVLSSERLLQHLSSFEWPGPDEKAIPLDTAAQLEAWLREEQLAR